jgi:L,D-peptidoglycan transpeptidase YkuD (ErfK/YbiS/YcfS/YnhG family)
MTRRTAMAILGAAAITAPVSGAPVPAACRQLLRVESRDWAATTGILTLWTRERTGAAWQQWGRAIPVTLGRSGLRWGRGLHANPRGAALKKEGDGCSPAGIFALDHAFGNMPAAKSGAARWPWRQMTASHAGVDDSKSLYYNRVVDAAAVKKDWTSAENMVPAGGVYRRGVVVRHNWDQRPGAGSCIFLHIWQSSRTPTAGCTAMSARDMLRVISWLDSAKQPRLVQMPRAEWQAGRMTSGLPGEIADRR